MIDTELEELLRATFAERAGTVQSGPSWKPSTPAAPAPRRYRWIAPLAAAVITGAVAATVLTVRPDHDSVRPATTTSTSARPSVTGHPTPTATSHSTVPVARAVVAKVCPLPAAWQDVLTAPAESFGAVAAQPLSVASDGTVVLYLDRGPDHAAAREVALLAPGAGTPQVVYRVDDPDHYGVWQAWKYSHWLVVATSPMPRPDKGTIPGDSPLPNVHQLVVVDLAAGTSRIVASTKPDRGPSVDALTVQAGAIFWVEHPSWGSPIGTVKSYRLADGSRVTGDPIPQLGSYPSFGPAGLSGEGVIVVPDGWPALPAAVAAALPDDAAHRAARQSLVTDGVAYAWAIGSKIGWWRPDEPVQSLDLGARDGDFVAGPISVFGGYVHAFLNRASSGGPPVVVDVASGSYATVPESVGEQSKFAAYPTQVASSTVVAGVRYGPEQGRWVDGYWVDPQPRLTRFETSALTAIRC